MDDLTRNVERDEGVVRISGGTTPNAFPHLCPFRPTGATREFCAETTGNYQRNKAGCFGTIDRRGFAPCNSELRKCAVCLVRGESKLKRPVVDLKRGLCDVHYAEAEVPPFPPPTPTRSVYFAPTFAEKQRPERTILVPADPVTPLQVEPEFEVVPAPPPPASPLTGYNSAFSGIRPIRVRMSRGEKIGVLVGIATRLREEKRSVSIPRILTEALKKGGPLENKTTEGSLRVFLYTLEATEKTAIGL